MGCAPVDLRGVARGQSQANSGGDDFQYRADRDRGEDDWQPAAIASNRLLGGPSLREESTTAFWISAVGWEKPVPSWRICSRKPTSLALTPPSKPLPTPDRIIPTAA